MKILAIDMGTGTQDILVFDSSGPVENSVKMVMPSATQIAAARIRRATAAGRPLLLTGVTQGGGPCGWAIEAHLVTGIAAFATPEAAQTFDDDLAEIERIGIRLVSEDEAAKLTDVDRVVLQDLDLPAIRQALAAFDVSPHFDGIALACLDHGASPPGYSDRLFRFDHLKRVVAAENDLHAFALLPDELPPYLTRARAMLATARKQDAGAPLVFLDTGPAAALGALQDPHVARAATQLVLNLGNMHALAFHLQGTRIISLYEHHTGELSREQIVDFTERLIAGTLPHEEVFATKGHGVFYAPDASEADAPFVVTLSNHERKAPALSLSKGARPLVAVTGPQRGKVRDTRLDPYFATPHGDMMISGCFGLLQAFAAKYPAHTEEIRHALAV